MSAREQAAAIPFRRRRDGVQVCLIRNRGSAKWKIPKGFVDAGETPEEAALKEACEEAGLGGRLTGAAIGTYEYEKWGLDLTVTVFLMEVTEEADDWEESAFRERSWHPLDEAVARLRRHPVSPLLDVARSKIERRSRPR